LSPHLPFSCVPFLTFLCFSLPSPLATQNFRCFIFVLGVARLQSFPGFDFFEFKTVLAPLSFSFFSPPHFSAPILDSRNRYVAFSISFFQAVVSWPLVSFSGILPSRSPCAPPSFFFLSPGLGFCAAFDPVLSMFGYCSHIFSENYFFLSRGFCARSYEALHNFGPAVDRLVL